jgi:hypothetical protein
VRYLNFGRFIIVVINIFEVKVLVNLIINIVIVIIIFDLNENYGY